ncbi:hypothetical protein [Spirillospora sp. NPDC029432]|uniref:hypothetical protein n=1 Tax=Spirillospora sp. NPDC029432 TaxID=3154599 RepID=UPI0034537505
MTTARCCESPALSWLAKLAARGVPHGHAGHDVVHDYTVLSRCGACGGGVVEHHSHDCWDPGDHSSWSMYWWWRVDPADMDAVLELAAACPAPSDPECDCRLHRGLGAETPPRAAPSRETPYERAPVPSAKVRVGTDGLPRWA